MNRHGLPIRILSMLLVVIMSFSLAACNSEPDEYVDPDEGKMPDFNYIIFPILTQAQDLYDRIFSSVEYGNRKITIGDVDYYFVEPSEYETESFDSLIRGTFTKQYADEYIEMMYGGDNPLYVVQDGDLYVNPQKLIDFEPVEYNVDYCVVSSYMGAYATITVRSVDDVTYKFDLENIDGIWYLAGKLI